MAGFKLRQNPNGLISLQFLSSEAGPDGTNVPVLRCEHLFKIDALKAFCEKATLLIFSIENAEKAEKEEVEFENLKEDDL